MAARATRPLSTAAIGASLIGNTKDKPVSMTQKGKRVKKPMDEGKLELKKDSSGQTAVPIPSAPQAGSTSTATIKKRNSKKSSKKYGHVSTTPHSLSLCLCIYVCL